MISAAVIEISGKNPGKGPRSRTRHCQEMELSESLGIDLHHVNGFADNINLACRQVISVSVENIQLPSLTYIGNLAAANGLNAGHVKVRTQRAELRKPGNSGCGIEYGEASANQ